MKEGSATRKGKFQVLSRIVKDPFKGIGIVQRERCILLPPAYERDIHWIDRDRDIYLFHDVRMDFEIDLNVSHFLLMIMVGGGDGEGEGESGGMFSFFKISRVTPPSLALSSPSPPHTIH